MRRQQDDGNATDANGTDASDALDALDVEVGMGENVSGLGWPKLG